SDVYLVLLVKSVTTLLPLVPAYVLFKALRSQARVSGPLKGLTVQLGGPFAAYFIVFFILWKGFDVEVERFHYHTWRVNGSVAFLEGGESVNNSDINCYIRPPELHVQKDGTFQFDIPVREDANGAPEWPILAMEVGGYIPTVVHFYEPGHEPGYGAPALKQDFKSKTRTIDLLEPVSFKAKNSQPPYEPARAEQPVEAAPVGTPRGRAQECT